MLKNNDYEKISHTILQLSNLDFQQSKNTFKSESLDILSNCLQYHHAVFWEIVNDELKQAPTTLNIEKHTISDYLNFYKYYDPLHPINMENQPLIQLIHEQDAIKLEKKMYYEKYFLKQTHYKDEMVMYLNNPNHSIAAIGFLRTQEENSFESMDILKLSYIRKTLENIYLLNENFSPTMLCKITIREEEILNHICQGFKNHEIAKLLFVSENTIKKHLQNLYRKFEVNNRTQLALIYSNNQ